jgi:hypothetical protein
MDYLPPRAADRIIDDVQERLLEGRAISSGARVRPSNSVEEPPRELVGNDLPAGLIFDLPGRTFESMGARRKSCAECGRRLLLGATLCAACYRISGRTPSEAVDQVTWPNEPGAVPAFSAICYGGARASSTTSLEPAGTILSLLDLVLC